MPCSLSETYYYLGSSIYPYQGWKTAFNTVRASIFTFTMWGMAFSLLPGMLGLTPEPYKFLCFLTTTGICFVGAAPQFLEKSEGIVHTAGAIVSAIFGIFWVYVITSYWYIPLILLGLCGVLGRHTSTLKTCKIFWLEMVAFFGVYIAVLFTAFT